MRGQSQGIFKSANKNGIISSNSSYDVVLGQARDFRDSYSQFLF